MTKHCEPPPVVVVILDLRKIPARPGRLRERNERQRAGPKATNPKPHTLKFISPSLSLSVYVCVCLNIDLFIGI